MTLQGPSPQGYLVFGQNTPKLSVSAYKSEITNLHQLNMHLVLIKN